VTTTAPTERTPDDYSELRGIISEALLSRARAVHNRINATST
jgi:hypothetical protein